MRCRECAAEVAATARACPRCQAPIVGQPPVMVDTVPADTAVGAVSDTAVSDAQRKAVAAGVAGQPREPYVPGSGEKLPAQLRLALAGYAGIACGWFAGGFVCAAAAVFLFFFVDEVASGDDLFSLGLGALAIVSAASPFLILGAVRGVQALEARIRFSRLLRRPSDPRTATVLASKRGGRTLILDIARDGTGRGYEPLSEVRLALWTKAGMLVPGER